MFSWVTENRPRDPSGKPRNGPASTGWVICARRSISIDWGRASQRCSNTTWKHTGAVGRPLAGRRCPSTDTMFLRCLRLTGKPVIRATVPPSCWPTLKGKGLDEIEDDEHWHGKALDRETANKV